MIPEHSLPFLVEEVSEQNFHPIYLFDLDFSSMLFVTVDRSSTHLEKGQAVRAVLRKIQGRG
jgi:hypothetical protein